MTKVWKAEIISALDLKQPPPQKKKKTFLKSKRKRDIQKEEDENKGKQIKRGRVWCFQVVLLPCCFHWLPNTSYEILMKLLEGQQQRWKYSVT